MNAQEKINTLEQEVLKLSKKVSLYQQIFKHLPQQVWVLDDEGKMVLCNDSTDYMISSLINLPIENAENLYIYKELEHSSSGNVIEMLRRNDAITKSNDKLMVFEERAQIDGEERVYLSHKKRYIDPETQDIYLLGVSSDITGLKQEEERLSAFVKEMRAISIAKKTLIQSFRHDLQTPISNILGAVDLMLHMPNDTDLDFFVESVKASAIRLKEYVNQLGNMSDLEKADTCLENSPVKLHKLVKNVISSFHVLAKNKGLVLNLEIGENVPLVLNTDQVRVCRIISNLVSNAIKYTEKGTVNVEISFLETDQSRILEIQVSDTGIGVAPSFQKAIFSPLLRINRKDSPESEGQGLGLSIVKGFVDDLEGQILVKSVVGEGSQFTVIIPIDSELFSENVANRNGT